MKHATPCEGREEEEGVEESEGDEEEEEGRGEVSELRRCDGEATSVAPYVEAETRKFHLKIAARQFSGNGQSVGFLSKCSSQLSKRTEFEDQLQNQIQLFSCPTPSSDLSPTSVTQSIQSVPSSMLEKMISSRVTNGECMPESNRKNSSSLKSTSVPTLKTSAADDFNWRKYGQKQVKNPRGSRSYYRCTYSECYAKKIECCDYTGHVAEIVYKCQHNHDAPRKISSMRKSKLPTSADPIVRDIENSRIVESSDPSTSLKEPDQDNSVSGSESKRQNSIYYANGNGEIAIKEEDVYEPEPKRRVKNLKHSDSLFKTGKKQEIVVHTADVGISGDGYRWRKYGQKMVKGNPRPRNYYRCTSAGCPVRKHTETDVENPITVIITYKGIHDHDMPVPKKRHSPPSAQLVVASAPASMNTTMHAKKAQKLHNQMPSSTQLSVAAEGEMNGEALDLGGEKAMESARTLLSMGFEIKPC